MAITANTGQFRHSSGGNSAYAVGNRVRELPPEVASGILDDVITSSAALQLGSVTRMARREKVFTLVETLPDAYWIKGTAATDKPSFGAGAGQTDSSRAAKDLSLKQTTAMTWKQAKMEAEEMAVMVPLPDTWAADSDIDFEEIKPYLVEAMSKKLDNAILFGAELPTSWSANGFNGVLPGALGAGNSLDASNIGTSAGQVRDLADAIAALAENMANVGYEPTGFVTYPGFRWKLVRLRDTNGSPIYTSLDGPIKQGIFGLPLAEVSNGTWNTHKADAHLITGDWSTLKIGIRQDIEFAVSDSAVITDQSGAIVLNTFQQDTKVLRATFRVAATVINPLKRLGGNYPFYALRPDANFSS